MNPCTIYLGAGLICIAIVILSFILATKTEILKDISNASKKSFSLASFQLYLWTIIIACCYIISYFNGGGFGVLNNTCITLLGIGIGTTLAGRVIDNMQVQQVEEVNKNSMDMMMRHQDRDSSDILVGLLRDDQHNISIHRFQNLLFTMIFAALFIIDFLSNCSFPEFNSTELGLMGISSSGYVLMKYNEDLIASA